ncbi:MULTISPECIES: hypothetical protein [unclassified Marinobacter]|uniref:hypothetical protein n=1 Tax=unclassified Marinobacter TaxID=83889 RepID=UPI00126837A6|nr:MULTISPECIES: hypothetical protein [unclassified Marinobacter]QFS87050.1 hypothetical protein FIV08_09425 [Marinobacter sp. THAF197a]QFT50834.1 hypothetical protein FIU96_09345 [Marinobacter sp. THAF39]
MSSDSLHILNIKTYSQLCESFDINGDEPLSKDNFRCPIKSYRLLKQEARCQYLRGQHICGQEHLWGYVVETKSNNKVLIGNCCAEKHLGIEDKDIKLAFSRLRKSEKLEADRAKVRKFLAGRKEIENRLGYLKQVAESNFHEASRIVENLPGPILKTLRDRWKRRSFDLTWEYSVRKEVKREDGSTSTAEDWHLMDFRPLEGLGDWLTPRRGGWGISFSAVGRRLNNLPTHLFLSEPEIKEAEEVIKQVSQLDKIEQELVRQRKLMRNFCRKDNLDLLMQLTPNRKLRADAVRAAHRIIGEDLRQDASRVVDNFDDSLRRKYGASGLRMAS